jgi:beta-glucosidase
MCSYNRVNGVYACEDQFLLNEVLKHEFGFKGWVLSDWEATHSTVKAALAGLDMEQPGDKYFGEPLKQAVRSGEVPLSRLDDMVHRIVRSMVAAGVVDDPPARSVVDPFRGRDDAQRIEEKSIVLLRNERSLLPLDPKRVHRVAIIGSHADVGVLSGGGSAQVDAPGGNAIDPKPGTSPSGQPIYFPSSPLRSIREQLPLGTSVVFDAGADPAEAAKAASRAEVSIVFAQQWMREWYDVPILSLPHGQDQLIEAVASANPNTIVVLETGGPVSMPWAPKVKAILEAWYPGIGGGQAIANVLFGVINPSGKLPVTFAVTEKDLPHPDLSGMRTTMTSTGLESLPAREQPHDFSVDYDVEGMMTGYRWFQNKKVAPQFPFGFGLSYTKFVYSELKVAADGSSVSFDIRNTGDREGDEVAEVYVTLPATSGEPFRKLAAWKRVTLSPGATQTVIVPIAPLYLSTFTIDKNSWIRLGGDYLIEAGASSEDTPLHQTLHLAAQ